MQSASSRSDMSITDRTREAVDERLSRLRGDYDSVRVLGETVELPPDRFDQERRAVERRGTGGVSAWVVSEDGALLMRRDPDGRGAWTVPGGRVRPDETFETAVCRHVAETAGVECTITGLYELRRTRVVPRTDPDGPTIYELWATFDCATSGQPPDPGTTADGGTVDWWSEPPSPVAVPFRERIEEWAAGWIGEDDHWGTGES